MLHKRTSVKNKLFCSKPVRAPWHSMFHSGCRYPALFLVQAWPLTVPLIYNATDALNKRVRSG